MCKLCHVITLTTIYRGPKMFHVEHFWYVDCQNKCSTWNILVSHQPPAFPASLQQPFICFPRGRRYIRDSWLCPAKERHALSGLYQVLNSLAVQINCRNPVIIWFVSAVETSEDMFWFNSTSFISSATQRTSLWSIRWINLNYYLSSQSCFII